MFPKLPGCGKQNQHHLVHRRRNILYRFILISIARRGRLLSTQHANTWFYSLPNGVCVYSATTLCVCVFWELMTCEAVPLIQQQMLAYYLRCVFDKNKVSQLGVCVSSAQGGMTRRPFLLLLALTQESPRNTGACISVKCWFIWSIDFPPRSLWRSVLFRTSAW